MRLPGKIFTSVIVIAAVFLFAPVAAKAASFYFSPANSAFIQGCTSEVVVMIDTAGSNSNAADIEISYNPAQVSIIDTDPGLAGIQVGTGNAYQAYVYNSASGGIIRVAAGSFLGDLNGTATFLRIPFQSVGATAATTFTINFTGAGDTLDSNIAETSTSDDLLTSVTNGSYTFSAGSCIADTTAPNITFPYPGNGATGVPASANLTVNITDGASGVDIDTVVVTFNGVPYTNGDPGFSFSGTPGSYTITIDPIGGVPQGVASTVSVQADDLAGNSASRIITFNVPSSPQPTPVPTDKVPPVIDPQDPTDGAQIEIDTDISIILTDDNSGIDLGSIILILNGTEYRFNSPQVDYSGDPMSYTLILTPQDMLPDDQYSYLTIFVKDKSGNAAIKTITFGPDFSELPDTSCECTVTPTPTGGVTTTPVPTQVVYNDELTRQYEQLNMALPGSLRGSGLPAIGALLLAIVSGMAMLSLLFVPNLLIFLFARGHKNPWGVIYHEGTAEPVAGASVMLKKGDGEAALGESTTDYYGRYEFDQPAGDYMLEIRKNGYGDKDLMIKHEINSQIDYVNLVPDTTGPLLMLWAVVKKVVRFMQKENLAIAIVGLSLALVSHMFAATLLSTLLVGYYTLWASVSSIMRFAKA
ncbi:MAG: hypothetical protein TR69_WS6001000622 [candidate division WS6 bacterium OLB20]|uniref:Uncharacterized protein n=1 Tax=candidate division WS6 bacterium OLB20 TaxID=1617426 RepID=A0A136LY95_9BACT|nr:MAG: hypothetical protein TR69_WS6001000622 [candidate division WS6 bacterium OLB20]